MELALLLLDKGADVNKANISGLSPLLKSCLMGNLEMVRLLLSRGAKDNDTAHASQELAEVATNKGYSNLGAWLTARVGWHPMQYSCEVGWRLWSPSTHQYFPWTFRNGIVAMLSVDRRLKYQVGKEVFYHLLSFCGWDWFEVVVEENEEDRRPN